MAEVDEEGPTGSTPAPDAQAADQPRRRLPGSPRWPAVTVLWRPAAIFLASRVVTLVGALMASTLASRVADDLSTGRPWPRLPPTDFLILRALGAWDGGWYVRIAQLGYPESAGGPVPLPDFAFFPGFPMSVRAMSRVTGVSPTVIGVALSMLFGLSTAVLLWVLAQRLGGRDMADRAVALFCFFPGSIVLSMAYSESMMITFSLACLIALLARRWWWAGAAAALATATRPNAVALCLCCAWAAGVAIHKRREWKSLVAPVLSVAGVGAYFAYLWARTGEPLLWFRVQQESWGERFDFGAGSWRRLRDTFDTPFDPHHFRDVNALVATLGLLFVVVALWFLWRWRPPAVLTIFTLVVLGLALTSQTLGLRPRFVMTAFPLFLALAAKLRGTPFQATVMTSAGLLGVFMILSVATTLATP